MLLQCLERQYSSPKLYVRMKPIRWDIAKSEQLSNRTKLITQISGLKPLTSKELVNN